MTPLFSLKLLMILLKKIQRRGDISSNILDYLNVENIKFGRFCFLPKTHKSMHNIPGRPMISNCGFYTEDISAFLDHQLKPIAIQVKSYIKEINNILKKLRDPQIYQKSL